MCRPSRAFAGASRSPTAPGRVSARRPTSFLCGCKERTQRNHLEVRTSMWERVIAGPCVQHLVLFAASRKALLDSATDPAGGMRTLAHSVTWVDESLRASWAVSRQWTSARTVRAGASGIGGICRARLCERSPTDAGPGCGGFGAPTPTWVFQVLSLPTFFAPAKKVGRPPGRNPGRGRWGIELSAEWRHGAATSHPATGLSACSQSHGGRPVP